MASGGERGNAYSAPDPCAESLDKMTKRLTADLRVKVRRLAHHEPLSPEWLEMADTLQHLASVAMMEEKDGAKKEGSIWERDELCVRYIIEEGKINMLARTMREFKEWQYKAEKEGVKLDDDSRLRVKVFEQSLGTLMKYAFTAVESLQTLDLTTLTEHIANVLKHSLGDYSAPLADHTVQELLVVQYLDLLFRHIEQLNEETVMKLVEQHEIVPLVLKHHEKLGSTMDKDTQEALAFFLAHLMETEFYSTYKAKIFADPADKKRLVALDGLTKELVAADPERKKALRALQDNIIRYK